MSSSDEHWMNLALQWAERGLYTASPNPCVGAVIVKNNTLLGCGTHEKAGLPHAEINALAQTTRSQTQGATAYVTLEPCAHQGRTGPCTEHLIQAGIERVVVALVDPNPLVQGRGIAALQKAGCQVQVGVLAERAENLNAGFISAMTRQRPWIKAKIAMSLDAKVALASGASQWITGEAARAQVQMIRAASDVILTGVRTVAHDDPLFTVRASQFPASGHEHPEHPLHTWLRLGNQPLCVIVDGAFEIPPDAQILKDPERIVWIATSEEAIEKNPEKYCLLQAHKHIRIQPYGRTRPIDLSALIADLHRHEYRNILIEAGPDLTSAFLTGDWIDEITLFMAPKLLGHTAKNWFDGPTELNVLQHSPIWKYGSHQQIGEDLCINLKRRETI